MERNYHYLGSNVNKLKHYYLSQRSKSWIEAEILCLSNGMRLTTIESNAEFSYLEDIADKHFSETKFYINRSIGSQVDECIAFMKNKITNATVDVVEDCVNTKSKFLCEKVSHTITDSM